MLPCITFPAEDPGNPSRHVVRWYLYDGLGSVIAEVGENVFMEADNTPCVPVLGVNRLDVYGNDLGGSSGASSHKFVGKLGHTTNNNTGLIYMQARYYDPALGRFISEDPAKDGVNWFVYCRNNPVNAVDPDGKWVTFLIAAIIIAVLIYEAVIFIISSAEFIRSGNAAHKSAMREREKEAAGQGGYDCDEDDRDEIMSGWQRRYHQVVENEDDFRKMVEEGAQRAIDSYTGAPGCEPTR